MTNSTLFAQVLHGLPHYSVQDPQRAALLVVDMQYLDAHPDYGLGRRAREQGTAHHLEGYFARVQDVTANIQRLLRACRDVGVEVIYTTIAARTRDGREISRVHRDLDILAPVGSREADVLDELKPQDDEIVLHKTCGGVFNSTELDYILRNLGIDTLIVTGVVTNGCVETAVRDAADRSYKVILISDACTAFSEELHKNTLDSVGDKLCNIRTSDALLEELQRMEQKVVFD